MRITIMAIGSHGDVQPLVALGVGFGSLLGHHAQQLTNVVLKALAQSQQPGLLVAGWGGFSQSDLPPDVFMVDTVPLDWLFPRMAAAVHHGGAGTTACAWRAGNSLGGGALYARINPCVPAPPRWARKFAAKTVWEMPPGSSNGLYCAEIDVDSAVDQEYNIYK